MKVKTFMFFFLRMHKISAESMIKDNHPKTRSEAEWGGGYQVKIVSLYPHPTQHSWDNILF